MKLSRIAFLGLLIFPCVLLFGNLANAQKARTITETNEWNARRQIVEQMFADGIIDRTATDSNDKPLTVDKLIKEIKFRAADLNGDGVAEYIVEASFSMGVCGSSGCVTWIYQRKGNTWKQLIEEPGNGAISVGAIRTNGFFDIRLASQMGVYDQFFHTLKFDGNRYRHYSCIEHNYIDSKGNVMKHPRITKC